MTNNQDWRPSASIQTLKHRAETIARIRDFFTQRGYLEVETPIMAQHGVSDVYLNNIETRFRNKPYYLQTSPEYHMKRLLAAGSGPIFQLARVFRDDELGRWHNPEFTLLEWYKLDVDHHELMDEMAAFLQVVLSCGEMQRISYQQAFMAACDLDPFSANLAELRQCLKTFHLDNVLPEIETDRDQYLFLLMSHIVEPYLAKIDTPVAVFNFPPSQASLAQIKNGVAERFELYYKGVELANGFHELTDAKAQQRRFMEDNLKRLALGLPEREADHYLISALEHGLPVCSGVALGIDRLLAVQLGRKSLSEVLAFDVAQA